jgi:hypothetical protein
MECLEFRRAVGGDPSHLSVEAEQHRSQCERCAAHHRQLLAMDATILQALSVPVREYSDSTRRSITRAQRRPTRPRWLAIAASIVAGVLIGSVLWVSQPRTSLAREVVDHMRHEPGSLVVTQQPASPADLDRVLAANGFRLRGDAGLVSYVRSCPFHGSTVPHLVVQTDSGPVTVLVLHKDPVTTPVRFHEQGYTGTITAFGPGSIALIGASDANRAQVEARLRDAVEWVSP